MIRKYIKTTPVEAIQVTEGNHEEVREFANNQPVIFGDKFNYHDIDEIEVIGNVYENPELLEKH